MDSNSLRPSEQMNRLFASKTYVANGFVRVNHGIVLSIVQVWIALILSITTAHAQTAISSDDFMKQIRTDSVRTVAQHAYPLGPLETPIPPSDPSSATRSMDPSRRWMPWSDWSERDPSCPDFYVELELLSLRRSNDSGGAISDGGGFDRLGREWAGRYTLGKLNSGLDRTEWVLMGPLKWERSDTNSGPVSTLLSQGSAPTSNIGAIHNADQHQQKQTASLSSLEWNRRWSSDGLSSFVGGFRLWDHDERFRLTGNQGPILGEFSSSTDNVLLGTQFGLGIVRPISQRLSVGAGGLVGVFGNFAKGSYRLLNDGNLIASQNDDAFRILWTAQPHAAVRYQISRNASISLGYEAIYFSKLATVSDLRLGNVAGGDMFSLRARDDQLFYGWTTGFSVKF